MRNFWKLKKINSIGHTKKKPRGSLQIFKCSSLFALTEDEEQKKTRLVFTLHAYYLTIESDRACQSMEVIHKTNFLIIDTFNDVLSPKR